MAGRVTWLSTLFALQIEQSAHLVRDCSAAKLYMHIGFGYGCTMAFAKDDAVES